MNKKLEDASSAIIDICKKYELKTLENKTTELTNQISNFALKILFVGGFSAGKSALLNTYINRDLLEENQRPETAIANELIFDDNEYIEAVYSNGTDKYAVTDSQAIDLKKYDYLIWHINNENIKGLENITLVDMPGFNSGINEHNKAILRYSAQGNAYVLIIDCEEGTIKKSITDFISEIKQYNNNLAIAISKCDLKTEQEIEEIKNSIQFDAETLFCDDIKITTVSKTDPDVTVKLNDIFSSFNQEKICFNQYSPNLLNIANSCINSLNIIKSTMTYDENEFIKDIEAHEKSKTELEKKLKNEKRKLENRFNDYVLTGIVTDVKNALYANINTLTSAIKSGGNSFSLAVNNVLRPVLVSSTQKYTEETFDDFISDLDFSSVCIENRGEKITEDIVKKFKDTNSAIEKLTESSENKSGIYKILTTTLAIGTEIVAPWLELIIIFLPDILNFFTKASQENKIREKIESELIPQIAARIQPEIKKSLDEIKEDMLQKITEEINGMIDDEMEALQTAKNSKDNYKEEFNSNMESIDNDIDCLKGIIEQII